MVEHAKQPKPPDAPRQAASPEEAVDGGERVAKALARAGVASRREVERYIAQGRVSLNGRVLETPAVKIGSGDELKVDGQVVAASEPTRIWRYHKPVGLVTTHSDPQGRPTVFGALPPGLPRVISIGRLDLNSEGLLLLTNDGSLARALELPTGGWTRRYRVRAYGRATQAMLDSLKDGITVDGVGYGPIEARLDKMQRRGGDLSETSANCWISVALAEGKNREVRRVFEALGLKVNRLVRLAYGPFALATLPSGAVEEVGPRVIREQLASFIAPEDMPTGERAITGLAAAPARRPGAPTPERDAPVREKKAYKPGWARPAKSPPGAMRARSRKAAGPAAEAVVHARPVEKGSGKASRSAKPSPARTRPATPRKPRPAR